MNKLERMKSILIIALCVLCGSAWGQDALNIDLVKQIDRGSTSYSGSWVYIDSEGEEYGLVGSASGTAIYSLEEGMDDELAFIPGPISRWREFTVIGEHAYVTTEGNGADQGLQVLELGGLPDTAFLLTTYDSTFTKGHILQKDIFNPDDPYIYVSGTDSTGGVHILDVSDPMLPVQVGLHNPEAYIHDVHVRGDRMYTFQFFAALIEVVDISDKTNPIVIATFDDPGGATHSGWTTADNNFLIVADERNGFDGRVFDIRDLENVTEVSTFTSNPLAFVHNPYVRGDFVYLAHNREGLRIYDVVDPSNPIEVGYYDTVTEENPASGGLWSACPFIPSGKVIGGDRDLGILVWEPEEVHASRFRGLVRDAATLEALDSVQVSIAERGDTLLTNGFGEYKSGYPGEEVITLRFDKEGFKSEIRTVSLDVDNQQIVDVLMEQGINVATSELANLPTFEVWPNPVGDILHLNLEAADFAMAREGQLVDALGRAALSLPLDGMGAYTLSMSGIVPGVYSLVVIDGDGILIATEIIVNH